MLASSLLLAAAVYATGVARIWRAAGWGRGIRPFEAAAFGAGWLSLIVALSPFVDAWSDRWQFAHMVQHELLMVVAAPLIAVSSPLVAMLWALPVRHRQGVVDAVRATPVARAWTWIAAPATAFFLYAIALWVWHIPALYDYAMNHEGVHIVQHLCFFGTSALFWWGLAHGRRGRLEYGAAVVYVFVTAIHGGLLGALLTLAPRVWYAPYQIGHAGGLTPLEDQQLAGLLMWIPSGIAFVAGGLLLFAAWLRHSDRASRFKPDPTWGQTRLR